MTTILAGLTTLAALSGLLAYLHHKGQTMSDTPEVEVPDEVEVEEETEEEVEVEEETEEAPAEEESA